MASVVSHAMLMILLFPVAFGEIHVYVTTFQGRRAIAIVADATEESYAEIRRVLLAAFTDAATEFMTRKLLSRQNPVSIKPPYWITLTLIGRVKDRTTLLLRSDNLYLIGFNNSGGQWYAFQGYKNLVSNSIELDYLVTYRSLLNVAPKDNPKEMIIQLKLGKEPFLDSIYAASSFPSNRRFNLGIALAKLIVMSLESIRFIPIGNMVEMYWSTEGYLDYQEAKYMVTWSAMSYMLLCSQEGYPWGGEWGKELNEMGLLGPEAVKNILNILIYPSAYNKPAKERCLKTIDKKK